MTFFVVVDVGCIECSEPTRIVGVWKTYKTALKHWVRYLKSVGANMDKYEPASALMLVLKGDEMVENGLLNQQGYSSGGQHSVELFEVPT